MTMNRFALVAAACLLFASTAVAAPTIGFVDNLDGTVTLQITTTSTGSIATELAASVSGSGNLIITDVIVADTILVEVNNPGNNPFTGGVTFGLYHNGNDIFASHGMGILSSGTPLDYLLISYIGTGTIDAFGLVAGGSTFPGLTASINVTTVPEPSTVLLAGLALLGVAGRRRF